MDQKVFHKLQLEILKGDMSIVGPAPNAPRFPPSTKKNSLSGTSVSRPSADTGYAQVYGQYNTTPYDKLLMDLMYISEPSLFEDFKIMFATVKILFMKESTAGVAEGQTTAMGKK